jgi:hypothetical protein
MATPRATKVSGTETISMELTSTSISTCCTSFVVRVISEEMPSSALGPGVQS